MANLSQQLNRVLEALWASNINLRELLLHFLALLDH